MPACLALILAAALAPACLALLAGLCGEIAGYFRNGPDDIYY